MLDKRIEDLKAAGATFLSMKDAVSHYRSRFPEGRDEL
jgi:hypothetical protein